MDPYRRMLAVRLSHKLRENSAYAQNLGVEISTVLRQPTEKSENHSILKEKATNEQVCRN